MVLSIIVIPHYIKKATPLPSVNTGIKMRGVRNMPIFPVTSAAEVGGSLSKNGPHKSVRPYPKNKK
jgi:hypothetical protein